MTNNKNVYDLSFSSVECQTIDTQYNLKDNTKLSKNNYFNKFLERKKFIQKSIQMNTYFWSLLLLCVISFSIQNVSVVRNILNSIGGIFVLFFSMVTGYFVHLISHYTNFTEMYEEIITNCFKLRFDTPFHNFISNNIQYVMDFHDIYHHDSIINKHPLMLVIEFLNNIWMQGGIWIFYLHI